LAHHKPFQVFGYHSCDRETGLKIIKGEDDLNPSNNPWDWLGPGVYFWEQNPEKAMDYAIKCAIGKQKFNGSITTPFVIGAIIELGHCLNLVEPGSLNILRESYLELKETMKASGSELPVNKGPNRILDCAVIQNIHKSNLQTGLQPYDSIRCPFHEDTAIYDTSNFTAGLHIEICVLTRQLITGYFLPRPLEIYNPFLNTSFDKQFYLKQWEEEKAKIKKKTQN
jgi:hypothetical protein